MDHIKLWKVAVVLPLLVLALHLNGLSARPASAQGIDSTDGLQIDYPERTIDLPGHQVQFSSPVLGDLDQAPGGDLEIVVGTMDGWIYAARADGSILWSFQTSTALNQLAVVPSPTTIRTAPCLADLNGDGWLEVIVGVGTVLAQRENGGVVVLDHTGQLLPGWPVLTLAVDSEFSEGVATSPAVGDLDNDGTLEIVFGAFDFRIYAYHLDGTLVPGWPRFALDTVWSSPLVADLDKDGHSEVIIGVDAHNEPYFSTLDGGYLYVLDGNGEMRPGFPKHIYQIISSSPAVADLDQDGYLDIIVGSGTFYGGNGGYLVSAWDRNGNPLPGWPAATGGNVPGSPAIGDIDGNGDLEVVVGAQDNKVWAWNHDGTVLWATSPRDWTGVARSPESPILADYDNDGKLESFFSIGWEVGILDHDGSQLTWDGEGNNSSNLPTYYASYTLNNTPAVGDIDNDGTTELVVAGRHKDSTDGKIYIWKFPQPADPTIRDWSMFRRDASHTACQAPTPAYDANIVSSNIPDIVGPGSDTVWEITVENTGSQSWSSFSWGLSGSNSAFTSLSFLPLNMGETIAPGEQKTFSFAVSAPTTPGLYPLVWRMSSQGGSAFGAQFSQEIKVGNQPALYTWGNIDQNWQQIYPGGLAPELAGTNLSFPWIDAIAMDMRPDGKGGYLLTKIGALYWFGNVPDYGGWGLQDSIDLVVAAHGSGLYRLATNGKIDQTAGLPPIQPAPPIFGDARARSLAITESGLGAYVLDGYGQVHRGGNAPALTPATPTWGENIAKRIKLTADESGYYVLDAYGRLHAGGSAVTIPANYAYQIGADWARDFELTDDGLGYYMIDKHGVIHTGGTAEEITVNLPPTWPGDVAVDIELVNSYRVETPDLAPNVPLITFMIDPDSPERGTWQTALDLVNQGGGGTLSWQVTVSDPVSWLSVSPTDGVTPDTLNVAIQNPPGSTGIYQTRLTIDGYLGDELVDTIETTIKLQIVENLTLVYMPLSLR